MDVLAALPRLVVGTSHLGSVVPDALLGSREGALRHLDELEGIGCTAFDLAASYQLGGTERLFGAWMRSRKNRDRLFLISKGGHPVPVVAPNRLTPPAIEADLSASLRRLGTDRVDLYLLHRDHPRADLAALADLLAGEQRRGRIRAWGLSNWTHGRFAAMQGVARSAGTAPPVASSVHFSLAAWAHPPWPGSVSIAGPEDGEARAFYAAERLPLLAYAPLGQGFFGDGADSRPPSRSYAGAENLARRERARLLAAKKGRAATEIALAWLFSQPFAVHAVVASRRVSHMRRNLAAAALPLTPDEVRFLETGAPPPA